MKSTLAVSSHVLNQFHCDHPTVIALACKSDNAGCYAGASCFEGEYLICKKNKLRLLQQDFNEAQRGKDQADRESAKAKGILRSYLNKGNNINTANNVYEALS